MRSGALPAPSALDPCFRAQEVSYVVAQIAANAESAAAAERRSWSISSSGGRRPASPTCSPWRASAWRRTSSPLTWLHNSLRGAAALAGAVLAADLAHAEHGFWVVLGTLSVLALDLRLSTGQSVVRALLGTVVGIVVGAGIVLAVGTNTTLLWVLLPPAILVMGVAPAAISFAAGQAAFTVTALILFDLLEPGGLDTGFIRVEDVALGGAVSLVVGLLLWPRGAAQVLGTALAEAYVDAAAYLADAIHGVGTRRPPRRYWPAGASRRLDYTFRGYLAERGDKPYPLEDVTRLVNALPQLLCMPTRWPTSRATTATGPPAGTWSATRWTWTARVLVCREPPGKGAVPVCRGGRPGPGGASVATVWTADHLEAVRRIQGALVEPARAMARS